MQIQSLGGVLSGIDSRGRLDELLAEFGRAAGVPGLATEDNGVCQLVFDGRTRVNLLADETSHLVSWSDLGILPAGRTEPILRSLLQANLFWHGTHGATIGLMPEGDMAVLALRRPIEGLDAAGLREVVELMVETVPALARIVAGEGAEAPAATPLPSYLTAIRG